MGEEKPEWSKREGRNWDKIYSEHSLDEIPWYYEGPDRELVDLIENEKIKPISALDVGCEVGTESIYMGSKGIKVTGIDISGEAINIAKQRASKKNISVHFIAGDFFQIDFENESFDFINDRGFFHHVKPGGREIFAGKVYRLLSKNGCYFLRCWSDKEKRESGPYKISKKIINDVFSKYFKLGEIRDFGFGGKGALGYVCLMEKK